MKTISKINDELAIARQVTPEQLQQIAQSGFKSVLNLRSPGVKPRAVGDRMRILKIQTLRGPNYWSIRYHKLIVMRLDLEDLAERPSNQIPGFYEGLVEALPAKQQRLGLIKGLRGAECG